jgi:hypothetical protein
MASAALVVACALSLLGRSAGSLPPIALVDVPPSPVSRLAEGFTDGRSIFLVTSSEMFRIANAAAWRARPHCGDRLAVAKIASVIVHEEWHIRHGGDERGAYEAQATALLRLGFALESPLVRSVRASMQTVLKAQRDAGPARVGIRGGSADE